MQCGDFRSFDSGLRVCLVLQYNVLDPPFSHDQKLFDQNLRKSEYAFMLLVGKKVC